MKLMDNLIKYLKAIEKTGSYAFKWALNIEDINPAKSSRLLSDHCKINHDELMVRLKTHSWNLKYKIKHDSNLFKKKVDTIFNIIMN